MRTYRISPNIMQTFCLKDTEFLLYVHMLNSAKYFARSCCQTYSLKLVFISVEQKMKNVIALGKHGWNLFFQLNASLFIYLKINFVNLADGKKISKKYFLKSLIHSLLFMISRTSATVIHQFAVHIKFQQTWLCWCPKFIKDYIAARENLFLGLHLHCILNTSRYCTRIIYFFLYFSG